MAAPLIGRSVHTTIALWSPLPPWLAWSAAPLRAAIDAADPVLTDLIVTRIVELAQDGVYDIEELSSRTLSSLKLAGVSPPGSIVPFHTRGNSLRLIFVEPRSLGALLRPSFCSIPPFPAFTVAPTEDGAALGRKIESSTPRGGGRHYTFTKPFSFNSSAESGAFFFW